MKSIGNVVGMRVGASSHGYSVTVSMTAGSVLLPSGKLRHYNASGSSWINYIQAKQLRVFLIDPQIATDSFDDGEKAILCCGVDTDTSTPRGAYEGGLIVAGILDLPPSAYATTTVEKPLDPRERATLLTIIGALAEEANIDLSKHNKAGETVAAMLASKGVSVSARAIGEHLKAVRGALESRKA